MNLLCLRLLNATLTAFVEVTVISGTNEPGGVKNTKIKNDKTLIVTYFI